MLQNLGDLWVGEYGSGSYIEDVVVKSTSGVLSIDSDVGSLEIQESHYNVFLVGSVKKHVDLRRATEWAFLSLTNCDMDIWVGDNCGIIEADCEGYDWTKYINNDCGGEFWALFTDAF